MSAALTVDVYSDFVCPWCFLGKRRFEAALRERPGLAVAVQWRPFELDPDQPPGGVDRAAYLQAKFGDAERLREAHRTLAALGRDAGIRYRFDAIARMPNTRGAHVLAALAGERQDAVVEALFRAYFEDGRDIGDPEVLAAIAADAGLDGDEVRASLRARGRHPAIEAAEREARARGVSGVPLYVFAGRWAVSGAQESAAFVQAIDHVVAELAKAGGGGATPASRA